MDRSASTLPTPRPTSAAPSLPKQEGVTLVELLVVIAIVAILAGIGAPSFLRLIADNTLSTQANSLLADTRFARSEAIKRGKSVTLCPSSDPDAYSPVCDGSDWKTGWIVFVDANGNNTREGGTEELLRRHEKFNGTYSITGVSNSIVTAWRFTAEGRIAGSPNGLMFTGPSSASQNRYLCVSSAGRVRMAQKGATSCT